MAASRYGTLTNAIAAMHLANCTGLHLSLYGGWKTNQERNLRDEPSSVSFSVDVSNDSSLAPVHGCVSLCSWHRELVRYVIDILASFLFGFSNNVKYIRIFCFIEICSIYSYYKLLMTLYVASYSYALTLWRLKEDYQSWPLLLNIPKFIQQ